VPVAKNCATTVTYCVTIAYLGVRLLKMFSGLAPRVLGLKGLTCTLCLLLTSFVLMFVEADIWQSVSGD
jgi:hypothetical protein